MMMSAFPPSASRRFLIVSAPFGGFSRALADRLREAGAVCRRVILNGGDLLEWGLDEGVLYRGDLAGWPDWLADYLAREGVTDIITHGDGQPYAAAAIPVARAAGVAVHVTEQGYFRPHWVTLEADGVNGRSQLPRDPAHYLRAGANLAAPPPVPVGRITPAAVRHITVYHLAVYAMAAIFPRYRAGYQRAAAMQAVGHTRRYLLQRLRRAAHDEGLARVTEGAGDLHLVLLQRPGDSQLVQHSPYGETSRFIAEIIDSFARHARPDARLLFKAHPLDHGLQHHDRTVRAAAARAGVGARVHFADDGHFPSLIARAASVISVNSSGGLAALEAGLPTLVLGDAIYDMPGLTHQAGPASFWTAPERPDAELFARYRAVVMACTQINGAFSTRHGVALAAPVMAERLLKASVERRAWGQEHVADGLCEPGDPSERRLAAVGGR